MRAASPRLNRGGFGNSTNPLRSRLRIAATTPSASLPRFVKPII
jgi:hypothetical protein